MGTIREDLLARIEALFRLGEHSTANPYEAANAIERAQALLLEHNLTRQAIATSSEAAPTTEGIGKVEVISESGHDWRIRLLNVIAKANLCRVVNDKQRKAGVLFGTQTNVLAVVQMYDWLSTQLLAQSLAGWKAYSGRETLRAWKTAFFDGATAILRDRLQRPVDTFAQGAGSAIVLANDARLKAAVHKIFPTLGRSSHSVRSGSDGYGAGRTAGANVRFGAQGAIGSGARALGAGR